MQDTQMLERRQNQQTAGAVFAVWLQNSGGGIGTGVVVAVVAWQLGADAVAVARWSLMAGLLVFGVLMVLRSAIDEIVDAADYRTLIADLEAAQDENDDLQSLVASLRRDLAAAETYGAYRAARPGVVIPDRNGEPMPVRAPAPELADARTLLQRHFADGKWPAKDRMNTLLGWSSTRWFAARDVLAQHGIVASQGRNTVMLAASLADGLARLAGDGEVQNS